MTNQCTSSCESDQNCLYLCEDTCYCDISFEHCEEECKGDVECIRECEQCEDECAEEGCEGDECTEEGCKDDECTEEGCEGDECFDKRCKDDECTEEECDCDISVDECIKQCRGDELCIRECKLCEDQCPNNPDVLSYNTDRQSLSGKASGSLGTSAGIGFTIGGIALCGIAAAAVFKKHRDSKQTI